MSALNHPGRALSNKPMEQGQRFARERVTRYLRHYRDLFGHDPPHKLPCGTCLWPAELLVASRDIAATISTVAVPTPPRAAAPPGSPATDTIAAPMTPPLTLQHVRIGTAMRIDNPYSAGHGMLTVASASNPYSAALTAATSARSGELTTSAP